MDESDSSSSLLALRFFGVPRGLGFCGVDGADRFGVEALDLLADLVTESESSESTNTLRRLGLGGVLVIADSVEWSAESVAALVGTADPFLNAFKPHLICIHIYAERHRKLYFQQRKAHMNRRPLNCSPLSAVWSLHYLRSFCRLRGGSLCRRWRVRGLSSGATGGSKDLVQGELLGADRS